MTEAPRTIRQAFPGLRDDNAQVLIENSRLRDCPPGTVICSEGRVESAFYIILVGEVSVTARMADGTNRQLAHLGPGRFFGEMALIEDKPRTATVTAVDDVAVLELSKDTFDLLLKRSPAMASAMLRTLTANLRETDRAAIEDLSLKNAALTQALEDLKAAQAELIVRERMARDLEIAHTVQKSLLPSAFPSIGGWSIHGRNDPARAVGGDYFDVITLDERHVALLLADVADKSVQAALYMAVLRTLFVAESRRGSPPAETVLAVHRGYYAAALHSSFATAFYGVLDISTGAFQYVRAGHEQPLVLRDRGQRTERLAAEGRFLGMVESLSLEQRETTLNAGDVLLLFSDGVTDAVDASGTMYGMARFTAIAEQLAHVSARAICDGIVADILRFQGEADAADDITLLVVARRD